MRSRKAFTLLELIIAVGLSALILAGLGGIFSGLIKVWASVQDTNKVINMAGISMQWLTNDIREGEIKEIGTDNLKLNNSEYSFAGTVLRRNDEIMSDKIYALSFGYYDKDGNIETNDVRKIKYVSIALDIREGDKILNFKTGASTRNFRNEL